MLIRLTDADFLMATVVPKDWYVSEIVGVADPKVASKGDSQNVDVIFRIIEGEFAGKERARVFNSKAFGMFIPLIEAIEGRPLTSEDKLKIKNDGFDPKSFIGKRLKAEWTVGTYEGRLVNSVDNFAPLEKSTTAPF